MRVISDVHATAIVWFAATLLLQLGCVDKSEGIKKGEVAMTGQEASKEEQAEKMALDTVKDELSRDYEYTTKVTETPEQWEVLILPKGRVRGGGARVFLSKEPMSVTSVKYLQ